MLRARWRLHEGHRSRGWETALWPKDGRYIVPLKVAVRRAEKLELGATTTVRLSVDV